MKTREMKRILVTGAVGQIGSELTLELRKKYGADNVVATGRKTPPSDALKNSGPFYFIDVNKRESVVDVVKKHDIDTVYHMAAILSVVGEDKPSSLTTLLPIVLGFSPHPPVSVCGTGTLQLDSGFSRQCGIICFGTWNFPPRQASETPRVLDDAAILDSWTSASCSSLRLSSCVPASLKRWMVVQEYRPVVHRLRLPASP